MMKITATLLILSSVLHVKAIPAMFHEEIKLYGCSDTDSYKEWMRALDGEVLRYVDFNKGKVVEPQPPFVDHMTFPAAYEIAVDNWHYCKRNLNNILTALKKPPVKDGYVYYVANRCVFNSSELKDIQYIWSGNFDGDELFRWDSRVDQWVGYTEFGVKNAELWNKDPTLLAGKRAERESFCKHNIENYYPAVLNKRDGYVFYVANRCVFNSSELKDIQYIWSGNFDGDEFLRWDSRVDQWVGYTELGVKNAERWNKDPGSLARMRSNREAFCKPNTEIDYSAVLNKRGVEPKVILKPVTPRRRGEHTHMLRCSSYGFYPKVILVTWWRGEEPLTSGLSSTELSDGDWYYQYHSYLEYTPRSGENITCMVDHPSLYASIKMAWDDSMPESVKNKVAMGASGLVLGLVSFLSGLIYCQWKKRGRVPVPTANEDEDL